MTTTFTPAAFSNLWITISLKNKAIPAWKLSEALPKLLPMNILEGRQVIALSNHDLLPALDTLNTEILRLESLRLQVIARIEESGLPQELGARDTVELLTFRHHRNRPEAWRDVRLARTLPKYKTVQAALNTLQTAHASAITTELERVRTRVPVEDLDIAETQLVGLAAHLTPNELRTAAKQLCNLLDSDGPEPEEQKAYQRESLTLTAAENGVKFRGYLANENAELLRTVIHTGARPHKTTDGDHDPRPRDKRQADALTTALTVASNAWDTDTPGYGAKANITVTIDLDDLRTTTANTTANTTGQTHQPSRTNRPGGTDRTGGTSQPGGTDRTDRTGGTGQPGRTGQPGGTGGTGQSAGTGRMVYGDDLSAATVRRLACDAGIIPLVLGSNSEPLDVGRRERLVTRPIRHALNARDRGCVVCAAPPVMCDAHHLTSWLDGGPTTLTNLALLCRRHHVDLHAGRWHITITNGKVHVARPTWATSTAPSTGPAQPQSTHPTQPARPHPAQPAAAEPARPATTNQRTTPSTPPTRPNPPPPNPPPPNPPQELPDTPAPSPPPGATPTRPQHPNNNPAEPANPNPWDYTDPPTPRTTRWKADEATLTAAARFAVWGTRTPTEPATDPPPFITI
ncbi:DUF222 domain-containing protein [Kribbella sp. WER1]